MDNEQKVINFVIVNVASLEAGLIAKMSFDKQGGEIGSDLNKDWHLTDQVGSIEAAHCEIEFIDGSFCLKDSSGKTYINSSNMPLGKDKYARLVDEDEIQIGEYSIRVFIDRDAELKAGINSLEQFFTSHDSELLDDTIEADFENVEVAKEERKELDPLLTLDVIDDIPEDEENLFEESDDTEFDEVEEELLKHLTDNHSDKVHHISMQADTENDITAAIRLNSPSQSRFANIKDDLNQVVKKIAKNTIFHKTKPKEAQTAEIKLMDENELDLLEQEVARTYSSDTSSNAPKSLETSKPLNSRRVNNHVLAGPMLAGLGVEVGDSESIEKMQALSAEIGQTLRVCIQGLLDLNMQVKDSRYGIMNRSLQPIEDNPLRLGLSYEETIRTMFDDNKSTVHLSAPSSVDESLTMIKIHNEAVQHATNTALNHILNSLSPAALLKRFNRYSRDPSQDASDYKSWAWDMYENYYNELTSNRQQGFEKLFWEIFEQAYDQKVREKHAED